MNEDSGDLQVVLDEQLNNSSSEDSSSYQRDTVTDTVQLEDLQESAKEAAEQLLRGTLVTRSTNADGESNAVSKIPKIQLNYKNDTFLLFDYDDNQYNDDDDDDDDDNKYTGNNGQEVEANDFPVIFEDVTLLLKTCTDSMKNIRQFLEVFYGKLAFLTSEILLDFEVLNLTLCEDNIYNSYVTFKDIGMIFDILRENSIKEGNKNAPSVLQATVKTRERFVSRYNTLVELTQNSATLANVVPFTNDEEHPVLLEDNDNSVNPSKPKEVVYVNLDDDEENDIIEANKNTEQKDQTQYDDVYVDEIENKTSTSKDYGDKLLPQSYAGLPSGEIIVSNNDQRQEDDNMSRTDDDGDIEIEETL
ncbi:hypothetical protein TBLA_0E00130 [Henningerozyma blattae CBS 6284]|uniref:Reduced meiotic recombination protein 1 n=1 Tax=Henningerozyma blattae (strain ATCC 34711 / CBS 6284 / DSM 70876 / NBRC 10599 / NRRL Y-10934 / UCD 77-7) TaxID=1071380 RepID=I2H3X4_HENB6|nr:hypothetical protein TBLA_0E00130 [Tetrapisispora blattae CBS 6284]CCH61076.1 hypothetical protein TBLA_0E00130 [Tetrapisispora blattae CBS 6284]